MAARNKSKTRTITVEHRALERPDERGPTAQRLAQEDADLLTFGGNAQDGRVYQFADALLERVRKRNIVDARQYAALNKFRHHWHHAGLEPSVSSVDLNRIFAPDMTGFSGMAKSERQAFHRQQYRGAVQKMGMRLSHAVESVVCNDCPIESYGRSHLGWAHPLQARASTTEMLRAAADLAADLWKIPHFKDEAR